MKGFNPLQSASKSRRRRKHRPVVTRGHLIKAFSHPGISRAEVLDIVERYIDSSPVPPSWSSKGIKGTFGQQIYSLWVRHIAPLRLATYRGEFGRVSTPIIQSIHDFSADHLKSFKETHLIEETTSEVPKMICDEFNTYFSKDFHKLLLAASSK